MPKGQPFLHIGTPKQTTGGKAPYIDPERHMNARSHARPGRTGCEVPPSKETQLVPVICKTMTERFGDTPWGMGPKQCLLDSKLLKQ